MELHCRNKVFGLLNHLAGAAPNILSKGQPQFDYTRLSFRLGKELAGELHSALAEVRAELVS